MPTQPPGPKRSFVPHLLVLFFLTLFGALYYYYQQLHPEFSPSALLSSTHDQPSQIPASIIPSSPTRAPLISPIPTLAPPLPSGVQTYTFSHGDQVRGPKIKTLIVDPLAPSPGTTQAVTLTATYSQPISTVTIEVITDNHSAVHQLISVDGKEWQGSWQIKDTFARKYGFRLILASTPDSYNDIIWFRQ